MTQGSSTARLTDVLAGLGRVVGYYPGLVPILGGVKPAVLFGALWQAGAAAGPVRIPLADLERLCGFSRSELESARRELVMCGALVQRYARLDHQLVFRLRLEAMCR